MFGKCTQQKSMADHEEATAVLQSSNAILCEMVARVTNELIAFKEEVRASNAALRASIAEIKYYIAKLVFPDSEFGISSAEVSCQVSNTEMLNGEKLIPETERCSPEERLTVLSPTALNSAAAAATAVSGATSNCITPAQATATPLSSICFQAAPYTSQAADHVIVTPDVQWYASPTLSPDISNKRRKVDSPLPVHSAPASNSDASVEIAGSESSPQASPGSSSSGTSVTAAPSPSSSQDTVITSPHSTPPISAERREALSEDLIKAAIAGDSHRIRALVAQGANLEYGDNTRCWKPLHYAARAGHVEATRALIKLGANLEAKSNTENTPLHIAVWNKNDMCVRVLLSAGASVNAKDKYHTTPLHTAVRVATPVIIRALIAKGANRNARDNQKMTPKDRARNNTIRSML